MHSLPIRYIDTETTGFSPARGDRLVEVAVLDADGSVLLSTLINPGKRIPAHATQVHGITDAMVRNAPGIESVMPDILRHVAGCEIVLHNAPFDLAFLPEARAAAGRVTCTLKMAGTCVSGSKKLGILADMAGHKAEGAYHRAAADALATRSVHLWLLAQSAGKPERPAASVRTDARTPRVPTPASEVIRATTCCAPEDPRLVEVPPHLCPEASLQGKSWSSDADRHLLGLWERGAGIPAILTEIPRTPRAIFMRLELLGAIPKGAHPYAR